MRRVHSMYEKSNTSPVPSLAHPDHPHTASNHQTTSHQGFNFRRTIPDHQAEVSLKWLLPWNINNFADIFFLPPGLLSDHCVDPSCAWWQRPWPSAGNVCEEKWRDHLQRRLWVNRQDPLPKSGRTRRHKVCAMSRYWSTTKCLTCGFFKIDKVLERNSGVDWSPWSLEPFKDWLICPPGKYRLCTLQAL